LIARADKHWHGVKLHQPDWGESSHAIAFSSVLKMEKLEFHLILNAFWESLEFELGPGQPWQRWIDTSLTAPEDIKEWGSLADVPGFRYVAGPRSVVMLVRRYGYVG
jgi:glycogen operon protein